MWQQRQIFCLEVNDAFDGSVFLDEFESGRRTDVFNMLGEVGI